MNGFQCDTDCTMVDTAVSVSSANEPHSKPRLGQQNINYESEVTQFHTSSSSTVNLRQPGIIGNVRQPSIIGNVRRPDIGNVRRPDIGNVRRPGIGSVRRPGIGSVRRPGIGNVPQPNIGNVWQPTIGNVRQTTSGNYRQPTPANANMRQPTSGHSRQLPSGHARQPTTSYIQQPNHTKPVPGGVTGVEWPRGPDSHLDLDEDDSDLGEDMTHYMHSEFRLGVVGIVFIIAACLFFIVPSVISTRPGEHMSSYYLTGGILFVLGLMLMAVNIIWCCNEEAVLRKTKSRLEARALMLRTEAQENCGDRKCKPEVGLTQVTLHSGGRLHTTSTKSSHPKLSDYNKDCSDGGFLDHPRGITRQYTDSTALSDKSSPVTTSHDDGGFTVYKPKTRRLQPVESSGNNSFHNGINQAEPHRTQPDASRSNNDSNWYLNPNYLSDTQV